MTDITFRSDFSVDLVDHMGNDAAVLDAMLVSTLNDDTVPNMTADDAFRKINFLMKNRHGCYDEQTEVLTEDGWKRWPDVTGQESFLTLDIAAFTKDDAYELVNCGKLKRIDRNDMQGDDIPDYRGA